MASLRRKVQAAVPPTTPKRRFYAVEDPASGSPVPLEDLPGDAPMRAFDVRLSGLPREVEPGRFRAPLALRARYPAPVEASVMREDAAALVAALAGEATAGEVTIDALAGAEPPAFVASLALTVDYTGAR
ncbi:MAG: hypothetical protein EKK55_24320 [Rhodocyclaceae bacterium]|nr:MAG: hypothetical protein EKK55_24320 [Rhodocyclaceae bacterium]